WIPCFVTSALQVFVSHVVSADLYKVRVHYHGRRSVFSIYCTVYASILPLGDAPLIPKVRVVAVHNVQDRLICRSFACFICYTRPSSNLTRRRRKGSALSPWWYKTGSIIKITTNLGIALIIV
ncbi:hypothetical protein P692DRAFT_20226966, partial [Suillus brevipes Sb2]